MKALRHLLVAALFAGVGASGAAYAQSTSTPPPGGADNPLIAAVRQACAADMQRLCPNAQGADRRTCMTDHASELSKACADARAALIAQYQNNGGANPPASTPPQH